MRRCFVVVAVPGRLLAVDRFPKLARWRGFRGGQGHAAMQNTKSCHVASLPTASCCFTRMYASDLKNPKQIRKVYSRLY